MSGTEKIAIVEDDEVMREELRTLLRDAGYETVAITSFCNVAEQMGDCGAELVLLDINLPEKNGEVVLQEFRRCSQTPVIMLTSRVRETDEVLSMSYGADDYITKPYHPTILLLRIAAILKRTKATENHTVRYRDILVHVTKGTLERGGEEEILTKNEMLIFEMLLQNCNRIVSRDAMMTYVWDNNQYINDNALTVNVSRLRAKLANLGYPDAIETRVRQGYILLG